MHPVRPPARGNMHSRNKARKYLKNSGDILLLALSFLAGAYLAKQHAGMPSRFLPLGTWEIYLLLFFCLAWNFGARVFELYDEFRNRSWGVELTALGKNIMLQILFAILVLFLAKSRAYSRFFVFSFYLLMLVSSIFWRILLSRFFAWQQKNGHNLCHVLVVGGGTLAMGFAETVNAHRHLGYRLTGFIAKEPQPEMGGLYRGNIDQLGSLLERERIDEVVIAFPYSANDEIGRVIAICENYPVQLRIIPENFRFTRPRFRACRFSVN